MTENTLAPVDPARTALLLMDFQPAAVGMIAEPEALLARADDALAWARDRKIQVCFVRVAFAEEDYPAIPAHSKAFAPVAEYRVFGADSPETQVHPSLEVRDEDIVVRKTRFGAFSTTGLHEALRGRDIDTLILGGISTAGVVLSTLRHAADADYRVYVLADVTADQDPEVHRVLTEKVFPVQADVITTADLPALTA
jgi:nicotinamidase-related amidase